MTTQNSQDQSKGLRLVIAGIDFNPISTHVDYRRSVSGDSCTIRMEDISIDMHSDGCSLLMIDVPRAGLIYFNRNNGRIKLFPVGAEFLTAIPPSVESPRELAEGRVINGIVTATFEGKELEIIINETNDNNIIVDIVLYPQEIKVSVELQVRK